MKNWQQTLISIFVGMILAAAIFLVALPPRGVPVELLPAPTPAPLLIHISGAVQNPGVYQLPQGSRLNDAVEAAGGLKSDADLDAINLAARLRDGEKIHVRALGEVDQDLPGMTRSLPANENGASNPVSLVNINTASLEELQTLPNIGESRALAIIAYRESHSGFKSIEEIQEVRGIGPAIFDQLKDLISVD